MRFTVFFHSLTAHKALCLAAGAPWPDVASTTKSSASTSPDSLATTTTTTFPLLKPGNLSGITQGPPITSIPDLWSKHCSDDGAPCTAYCHADDTSCLQAGLAIAATCSPLWASYQQALYYGIGRGTQWSASTISSSGGLSTWTNSGYFVYTSFSTANVTFTKQNVNGNGMTTFVPVWGLGKPLPTYSVRSGSVPGITQADWSAPSPACSYTAVDTTTTTESCGPCTLEGGTVGLYYWPPAPSSSTAGNTSALPLSTILDGTTLYSPTVYISLATAFATDQCAQVGERHHGTLLAMNPTDVSTQIQTGGKVWANSFGRVHYEDLFGLPPATDYQRQPSCIMFGCPTMDTTYSPTLSVPQALRSMDAAWKECLLPLHGLYDPPQALTAASVMAKPTLPNAAYPGNTASPSAALSSPDSPRTTTYDAPSAAATSLQQSLSAILAGPDTIPSSTSISANRPGLTSQSEPMPATSRPDSPKIETSSSQIVPPSSKSNIEAFTAQITFSSPTNEPSVTQILAIISYLSHVLTSTSISVQMSSAVPPKVITGSDTDSGKRPADGTTFSVDGPISRTAASGQDHIPVHSPGGTNIVSDQDMTTGLTPDRTITSSLRSVQKPSISQDISSNFLVNGQTFAPNKPITLTEYDRTLTAQMLTSGDRTFIALGTSTTIPFGSAPRSKDVSSTTLSMATTSSLRTSRLSQGEQPPSTASVRTSNAAFVRICHVWILATIMACLLYT